MKQNDFLMKRRCELLYNSTDSEDRVCQVLKFMEIDFERQYPIKTSKRKLFFADIYLPKYNVIVEVDGGYHFVAEQKRLDRNRTRALNRVGFRVIRFKNSETYKPKIIINKIKNYLKL